ncbi:MAG: hypothetical protein K8R23_16360 [Chthoniobacter sp.]|nr:hypothetical protein [Chthoniobacter sp.]
MMFLGTRHYGKVNRTTTGSFIVTKFLHFFFVPLVPLESYIVTRSGVFQFTGIRIPLYRKSILTGYCRGWCAPGAFFFVLGVAYLLKNGPDSHVRHEDILYAQIAAWVGSFFTLGLYLSFAFPRVTHASAEIENWISDIIAKSITANHALHRSLDVSVRPQK